MKRIIVLTVVSFSICMTKLAVLAQPPTYVWAKTLPGNVESIQRAIVVDAVGNVYITGVFFGTVDFDPGIGTVNLTPVPYGSNAYIAKYDANGNYLWVKNISINASYGNNSIALDVNGNIYITGFYSGSGVDFDPGVAVAALSSASGSNDIYIAKYSNSGNYLWAKSIGSTGDDRGNEVLTDVTGNVLLTGNFSATVDFDPGVGSVNLTSAGLTDVFLAKYDCNGNYIWAKQIGGLGTDDVRDISLSNSGDIYLTGNFSSIADFDPGVPVLNLISAGGSDIFIAKYDVAGNYLWANRFGGTGTDGGSALKTDAAGNILVTGIFSGTVDFDQSAGVVNLTTGSSALFYGKYDINGNFLWIKQLPLNFYSMDITLDAAGNIFIEGNYGNGYASPIDMDPGSGVANLSVPTNLPPPTYNILCKYDATGNYLWAGVFGRQCYCSVMGYKSSLATDASYLYYSGIFNGPFGTGTVDFDPGPGVANLIAPSSVDNIFFAKYGISSGPLPVELISFKGENKNNVNHLYWSTASEINSDYFEVERSADGISFSIIGKVNSNGTSTQILNYSFNDINPFDGNNYYRLKQIDFSGQFSFSEIISIKTNKPQTDVYVYPNPSPKQLNCRLSLETDETINIFITDAIGNSIMKETTKGKKGIFNLKLNIEKLSQGIYFLNIDIGLQKTQLKFMKKQQ